MNRNVQLHMPSDREVLMIRHFSASAKNLFRAYTDPDILKRWMNGPEGWSLEVCEIDLRVGGRFRYEWRAARGEIMGMGGEYREIVEPLRLVTTEIYDEDWTGGETLVTTTFRDENDGAVLTTTILYSSMEARDAALRTGMKEGMEDSFQDLDTYFAGIVS